MSINKIIYQSSNFDTNFEHVFTYIQICEDIKCTIATSNIVYNKKTYLGTIKANIYNGLDTILSTFMYTYTFHLYIYVSMNPCDNLI